MPAVRTRRESGFTLMEMIVTMTVLAVLLAIAVPSFRGTMRRAQVGTAVNTLVGNLQYARAEAASRHKFVSFCRSVDGKTCADDGSNYDAGYLIYAYDASVTGANQTYDASKHTLLRTAPVVTQVSVIANDGKVLTFDQSGYPAANGTRTAETFVLCARKPGKTADKGENNNESPGSRVYLGVSGTLSTTKLPAGADCIPAD